MIMWQLVQLGGPEVDEVVLGEYPSEAWALTAGNSATEVDGPTLVIRHDRIDAWSNSAGPFERLHP